MSSVVTSVLALASTQSSLLGSGSHCVAYRVEKVAFLIRSDAVVGKNCDISAQVLPDLGGVYHVEVSVPIRGFQSGDSDRDQDVMKMLKADVKPDLIFRSKGMTAEQWQKLFAQSNFDLDGQLIIGEKSYPLKIASHYTDNAVDPEIDGIARVHFGDFSLSPPQIGGGMIVKTKPEFELHIHLLASRVLGADSIRPVVKTEKEGTR